MGANTVPNRWQWSFDHYGVSDGGILKNKELLVRSYVLYMLSRTQRIFHYEGLPDTIPQRNLEQIVQIGGLAIIMKGSDGNLYATRAGLGAELNAYYEPTIAIVANPYIPGGSKSLKIGEECVLMRNDSFFQGLMPLMSKYAAMLAEGDISIRYALINSRLSKFLTARDDNTKESAEKVLKGIEEGKDLALFLADDFLTDALKESNSPNRDTYVKDLIECYQYQKASWFNELGIQSQFNMKREAINSEESALNDDALLPLIQDMLEMRKQAVEDINRIFGTSISVRLSSAWEKEQKELEKEKKIAEQPLPEPTDQKDPEDPKDPEPEKEDEKEEPKDE